MWRKVFICFLLFSVFYSPYVSGNVPENCKVVYTFGYGYQQFFHLSGRNITNGTQLLFKFFVQARSDAHILLSSTPSPSDRDPVYEIVIGAGKNTFSDIRRLQRDDTKSSVSTLNLLSPVESHEFWVRISNNGMIQISQANNDMPFIFWQDPNPLYIRYYSFCTWPGVIGKWNFDCPENETKESESTEVEPELTMREKLRRDLFTNYDSYSVPVYNQDQDSHIPIHLHVKCWHISLDPYASTISLHGLATVIWMDEKLMWEPNEYGNIEELNIGTFLTWQPEIVLYNAVEFKSRPFKYGGTIIKSDGRVNWLPIVEMVARCEFDFINWPWDTHICKMHLGTWSHFAYFATDDIASLIERPNSTSNWVILDVQSKLVTVENMRSIIFPSLENFSNDSLILSTVLEVQIKLKRNTPFFHSMFTVIFIVFSLMSLTSFFISPLSSRKLMMNSLSVLFFSIFLLILANSVPEFTKQTPSILMGYTVMLLVVMLCCVLSVFLILLARTSHSSLPPVWIITALNTSFVSLLFCLPGEKLQDVEKYNKMEDESSPSSNSRQFSKKVLMISDVNKYWLRLATAIDRVSFIGISVLMAYIVYKFVMHE